MLLLREAFDPQAAREAREVLWRRLEVEHGIVQDDPATWTKPALSITDTFGTRLGEEAFQAVWTPRLLAALDQLLGKGNWNRPAALGWWHVSFPGFESAPWQPPRNGWHLDGAHFHHHLNSPDQGLLPLFLFSDVNPTDGGTAVSLGSHKECARVLAQAEPDGVQIHDLARRVLAQPGVLDEPRLLEMTGRAGDVALVHPFMLHARSPKIGGEVRFMCNPCISLKAPLNLEAPQTALERSIARALEAQPLATA